MLLLRCFRGGMWMLAVALLALTNEGHSANILGYLVSPGRSHFIIHDSLLRGLAQKGHNVTVVGIFPPRMPMPASYRYIQLEVTAADNVIIEAAKSIVLNKAENSGREMFHLPRLMSGFQSLMGSFLQRPEVDQLKSDGHFDLVVFGYFFNDYQLGLAAHFKCPSVIISSTPSMKSLRDFVGNPSGVAYTKYPYASKETGTMTFTDRLVTFLAHTGEALVFTLADYICYKPRYQELFPSDKYPPLDEVRKNISLVLVSAHASQTKNAATLPSFLEVSGIHIKARPDPLSPDIQTWLDDAKDGAIFFSFGTNINSSLITEEKRNIILASLSKLKQRVLWKYDSDELPNKPDNLMIGKWLPQDDILAHPNVRLFISHCGKGSVNEAKYHGVPILGIPMFGDQMENIKTIVDEGWAVELNYASLTEKSMSDGLSEILLNATYRNVVKQAADLYKDRPQHPLDLAVFWVEYILRHNGAKHLQSHAVDLNWFQLQSYDVLAVIFLTLWVSWKIGKIGFWFVVGRCCGLKRKTKQE